MSRLLIAALVLALAGASACLPEPVDCWTELVACRMDLPLPTPYPCYSAQRLVCETVPDDARPRCRCELMAR